jgi:hypothetical protein
MVRKSFIEQVGSLYDFLDVVTDDITTTDEDALPESVLKPLNEAFELLVEAMNAIKEEERKKVKWQKGAG